jgi:hypothetical protein
MWLKRFIFCVLAAIQITGTAQNANVLKEIIHTDSLDIKYKEVFEHHTKYHLQVIYTQITRDSANRPHLKRFFLYPSTTRYYYPASLVKLPLVAMALEKVDSLNRINKITKDTRVCVDSAHMCQTKESRDSTSDNGYPSIAQYIKRMLLVSDNTAYNRIYEFLSPAYIKRRLDRLGYKNAMINQRFGISCDSTFNRYTNPFLFLNIDSTLIYEQPADSNLNPIVNSAKDTKLGKGFMDKNNKIKPPKDFRHNNYMPFTDENDILLSIIFPKTVAPSKRFKLNNDDYKFLYKYMGMLPRESDCPYYTQKDYPDNFKKYIYYGTTDTIADTSIRSLNIVGRAYGFLADCSYMIDLNTNSEYCLSVLIYVNEKDILNTGKYEYDTIGLPFMADLGKAIMNYENKRKKKHKANLKEFQHLWSPTK